MGGASDTKPCLGSYPLRILPCRPASGFFVMIREAIADSKRKLDVGHADLLPLLLLSLLHFRARLFCHPPTNHKDLHPALIFCSSRDYSGDFPSNRADLTSVHS